MSYISGVRVFVGYIFHRRFFSANYRQFSFSPVTLSRELFFHSHAFRTNVELFFFFFSYSNHIRVRTRITIIRLIPGFGYPKSYFFFVPLLPQQIISVIVFLHSLILTITPWCSINIIGPAQRIVCYSNINYLFLYRIVVFKLKLCQVVRRSPGFYISLYFEYSFFDRY